MMMKLQCFAGMHSDCVSSHEPRRLLARIRKVKFLVNR